ncbi:MAG: hypothetical protein ACE5R4_16705, partial [Armatimonadota bacterium]
VKEGRRMLRCALAALSATACVAGTVLAQEDGMKITSSAAGNLFSTSQRVAFTVAEAGEAVAYEVLDYYGETVAEGEADVKEGSARIVLGRLAPGHYRLRSWADTASRTEGSLRSAGGEAATSFAVVRSRGRGRPSERVAVDGATAWLCQPEQWEPVAEMLRRAGIGWVRERLSWGQVQPKPGRRDGFEWGKYDTVADAFEREGVRVYQIFHDSPGWTHPDNRETRCPDDLRTVYRFAKAAGKAFAGRIVAWEPWNEPDIQPFWHELADRYAGVQKAAYLGFKAADPDLPVLSCSLCAGASGFAHNLFECGIADYYDIFNYHIYAAPKDYPHIIKAYLDLAGQYGCGDRPAWLTEAGIRLKHEGEGLTWESQQRQAEFAAQSVAISLASGTDRHFFFVLPHYPERGTQFGSLHADLSPRPGFVAVAAAADILGEAKYLGRYELEGCQAHAFDSGRQVVLAVWAEEEREVSLPVGRGKVEVADLLGKRLTVSTKRGVLGLTVGPAAQYVVGVGGGITKELTGTLRVGRMPENEPSPLVIAGHMNLPFDRRGNFYQVGAEGDIVLTVDVYNFRPRPLIGPIGVYGYRGREVEVALQASDEAGWALEPAGATVKVVPMGRETVTFAVRAAQDDRLHKLWVRAEAEGRRIAPTVSWVKW